MISRTLAIAALLQCALTLAHAQIDMEVPLDEARRGEIVETIGDLFVEHYVSEDVGRMVKAELAGRLSSGKYEEFVGLKAFAQQLTKDARAVSNDLHVRIEPLRQQNDEARLYFDVAEEEERSRVWRRIRYRNFSIPKVEVLPGNIGHLVLNKNEDPRIAASTLRAALEFLASTDALVIDVRDNGGGYEEINQILLGYLFEESTKIVTSQYRNEEKNKQFWTYPVHDSKFIDMPVYVLTSDSSFSASESLAFALQQLGRGTVVGERTTGGANFVDFFDVPEIGITAKISIGESFGPVSGQSYEAIGITPDIEVPAEKALYAACAHALGVLSPLESDEFIQSLNEFFLVRLKGQANPVVMDDTTKKEFVGAYTSRSGKTLFRVEMEGNELVSRINESNSTSTMTLLEPDLFVVFGQLGEAHLQFSRTAHGPIDGLSHVHIEKGGLKELRLDRTEQ